MSQNEISTGKTIQISGEQKKRVSFNAETPTQKRTAAALKTIAYMAGRYVTANVGDGGVRFGEQVINTDSVSGLLTGTVIINREPFYTVINKDRKVMLVHAECTPSLIKPENLPAEFSVLDYIKWHEPEFLVQLCKDETSSYEVPKPFIVNYQRQDPKTGDVLKAQTRRPDHNDGKKPQGKKRKNG